MSDDDSKDFSPLLADSTDSIFCIPRMPTPIKLPDYKKIRMEIEKKEMETKKKNEKCILCTMNGNFSYCCCDDYEYHYDCFFDWITFKHVDNPEMIYTSKGRWRYVLYSEYFALANYRKYRHSCCDGSVD